MANGAPDSWEDAFDQLWQRRKCELLRPLRVRLGEMEGTEVGQDLGGVQIEFFNLVCKALFAEDAGKYLLILVICWNTRDADNN